MIVELYINDVAIDVAEDIQLVMLKNQTSAKEIHQKQLFFQAQKTIIVFFHQHTI